MMNATPVVWIIRILLGVFGFLTATLVESPYYGFGLIVPAGVIAGLGYVDGYDTGKADSAAEK